MNRRVHLSLSIHYTGVGFTSAAVALAARLVPDLAPVVYLPQTTGRLPDGLRCRTPFRIGLPLRLAYRPAVLALAQRRTEAALLAAVRHEGGHPLVWLWPGATLDLQRALKAAGAVIVREMINCHRATSRAILDAEYGRLGMTPAHDIDDRSIAAEREELTLADHIVSPSACVDRSLTENGIDAARIIRATFGWDPDAILGAAPAELPGRGPHGLFVGQVGVRKGIHHAVAAWDRAAAGGTLIVVGSHDAAAEPLLAPYRGRADIVFMPYTRDLPGLYRAADFMFFPTLEEGAPLVCYQAGGAGLPILTTPMGQGRMVEDGETGIVTPPGDVEAMADGIRRLSDDRELRDRLARNIAVRARDMTWTAAADFRSHAFRAIG